MSEHQPNNVSAAGVLSDLPELPRCFTWSDEHARRLWDEEGMREYARASIAAASAHTIGEDAANVAIGEREAFEAWAKSKGLKFTCHAAHDYYSPHEVQCYYEVWQARAALTAEKVAGQEPYGYAPVHPNGNYFTRNKSTADYVGGLMPVYAAPQQPAQPVAQTLALTDFQINLLASHYWEVKEVMGARTDKFDAVGFARTLLAAQPASSLAEGGERE